MILVKHRLAVHVIMSGHVIILGLVNSVSNSFEYDKFKRGIFITYFSKALDTEHHTILLNRKVNTMTGSDIT